MKEYDINVHFIRINSNFSGQRIDNFLRTYLKPAPKSMIYKIIRIGAIRVNKKRIKFQYKLKTGDILRIPPVQKIRVNRHHTVTQCTKKMMYLQNIVLYEDDYLLVLNKPAGIVVHGGSGYNLGIIEGLRIIRPNVQFLELVHRLDRDTSGILLVAKKRIALIDLHEQLRLQRMKKEYLGLVHGEWDLDVKKISIPLLKKNIFYKNTRIVCMDLRKGRFAMTHFQIKENFGSIATLLMIQPITGRTHQIRVHAQYADHPIIGDEIYGDKTSNILFKQIGLNRLFLHASVLSFIHPYTKKNIHIHAPVDQFFYNCLYFLRNFMNGHNYIKKELNQ